MIKLANGRLLKDDKEFNFELCAKELCRDVLNDLIELDATNHQEQNHSPVEEAFVISMVVT